MSFLRNPFMTAYKARLYPNFWDVVALLFALGLIALLAWDAKQMSVPYHLGETITISLDPHQLPGYALRTVLRMFIALFFSLLFTFTFGTWAAKSKRAGRIIIPIIDICQSIPILSFLSVSIVGFISLFPNSLLGPECASILVIFTSQAWNMALGFYQTVRSVPVELREAANMFHLSAWQRFWRIDVPFSMPGLLWNTMMSMSAGWFFVVASEAVSVSNQQILLPGIGSYIAYAIQTMDKKAIGYAILTMFIVILLYDQLLFRPLVAWAEKFKAEHVATEKEPHSWVIDLLHRTRLLRILGGSLNQLFNRIVNFSWLQSGPDSQRQITLRHERLINGIFNTLLTLIVLGTVIYSVYFIARNIPLSSMGHIFFLGLVTALRVLVLIVICSLIWVPVGVWIGLRPGVAQMVQPLVQFLAAFPVNLLYPLVFILILKYHLNIEIWVTPLMILGVQWYVLFNVIAGASVLPKELLQVTDNLGATGWLRWRKLILPGIFPYYMTGAITAAGGAWNASIAAEIISWGQTKLVATGLGAYISESTATGNFLHMAVGTGVMCILVLFFNRVLWRPLYVMAETRYHLD
ncbi:MAG TPA: ABC transporter permease subunit [Gammaproteobacteria bacterium]|nr:ABC transporter permease subunit [Gammaproteobacteria bacterium]